MTKEDHEKRRAILERMAQTETISYTPTLDPVTILEGDSYDSRDVRCGRCATVFLQAPWPRQTAVCFRPRCSKCGSSFTYPLDLSYYE